MFQNKDKDLLGIYQYGCDPFCVSLLTDRHLRDLSLAMALAYMLNRGTAAVVNLNNTVTPRPCIIQLF